MKINVTQQHIDTGIPNKANLCPVALAIKEQLPQAKIRVDRDKIRINDIEYFDYTADLVVWAFDRGLTVSPFSFII